MICRFCLKIRDPQLTVLLWKSESSLHCTHFTHTHHRPHSGRFGHPHLPHDLHRLCRESSNIDCAPAEVSRSFQSVVMTCFRGYHFLSLIMSPLGVSSPFSPSHRTVRASRFSFSDCFHDCSRAARVHRHVDIVVFGLCSLLGTRGEQTLVERLDRRVPSLLPRLDRRSFIAASHCHPGSVADDFPLSDCVSWRASIVVQEVHVSSCMSRVLMQEEAVRPDLSTEPLPTCLFLRLGCPTYGHQFTSSVGTPPCASTSDRFGVSTGHGKRPSPRSSHCSAARARMP